MINQIVRQKSTGFLVLGIAIAVIVPVWLPVYWVQMFTQLAIFGLFATSLNIEMGFAGMMPIGQGTFMGLGAYAFAILFDKVGLPMPAAIILGLFICIILNLIIGWLCLRGRAMTFGLLHMAFNILFSTMVFKWISLTGGDTGITFPRTGIMANNYYFYLIVLAIVLFCYLIIRFILFSPFGNVAQGLRENEERLIFLGINTKNFQLVLFTIAGFFSGLAGMLLALLNGGAYPAYSQMLYSAEAMMMCLIGGAFTFWGPTLGAGLVVIFSNEISGIIQYWQGLLGAIMVAVVLGFRGGILRKRRRRSMISITTEPGNQMPGTASVKT
jgi:branched-chain amino acid transport system permease protein